MLKLTTPSYCSEQQTSTPVLIIHLSQCLHRALTDLIAQARNAGYLLPAALLLKSRALFQTRSRYGSRVLLAGHSILTQDRDEENRTGHRNVLIASAKNAIKRNSRSKLPNGNTSTNYFLALIQSSPMRLPDSSPRLNSSITRSPTCRPDCQVSAARSVNHLKNSIWSPSSTTTSPALRAHPAYHTHIPRVEDHEHLVEQWADPPWHD